MMAPPPATDTLIPTGHPNGSLRRCYEREATMSARTESEALLRDLAQGGGPLLETLTQMNAGSLGQADIDEQTALLVRFGALVALDAPAASYLIHLGLADEAGIKPETIRAALVTLAPLVGSARIVSAADRMQYALQQTLG
jgi:4-carboxymuconolactone decarboxylase